MRLIGLVFILLSTVTLSSEQTVLEVLQPTPSVASTDGVPSSLVAGSVCAITGAFVDCDVDLVLEGPERLVLQRVYSNDRELGNLGNGWSLNHGGGIQFQKSGHNQYGDAIGFAVVTQLNGSRFIYKACANGKTFDDIFPLNICPIRGLTNTAYGELSAQTNVKNDQVTVFKKKNSCEIVTGGGYKREFYWFNDNKPCFDEKARISPAGHRTNYIYRELINGKVEKSSSIRKILNKLPTGEESCWAQFKHEAKAYSSDKVLNSELSVITNTGQTVSYCFFHKSHKIKDKTLYGESVCKYLNCVIRSDAPTINYDYALKNLKKDLYQISAKKYPEDRVLSIVYDSANRVKELKAPVGFDKTLLTTHRFDYYPNIDRTTKTLLNGITHAFDAKGTKTIYHYDKYERLGNVEKFDRHGHQYCIESFIWGADKTPNEGHLLIRSLNDSSGQYLYGKTYDYDSKGNVEIERFYGNLTGKSNQKLIFSDWKFYGEKEEKRFGYSKDGLNLLISSVEENGRKIDYNYKPGTNLLTRELISDKGGIKKRTYHDYDDNSIIRKTIVDNATDVLRQDWTNITERRITYYTPTETSPFGMPAEIHEMYHDFPTGQEVLVRRTQCCYSPVGKLIEKKVFDNKNKHAYTLTWGYDGHGNLISETNALNQKTTYKYDANDNRIFEKNASYEVHYTYDYSNRLIKEEKKFFDGTTHITKHRYDILGNRTATTDHFGRETTYEYDEFGRQTKIVYPDQYNEHQKIVQPTEIMSYDALGNVISRTAPNKGITKTLYNARNQPIKITYPDGSQEHFEYTLDGKLSLKIEKNGTRIRYDYDIFGQMTCEEALSSKGEVLKKTDSVYNAFHLLSTTDASGLKTTFLYDTSGLLKEEKKGDHRTTYEYDSLGRLFKTFNWVGDQAKVSVTLYDALDRVVEERTEDLDGNVFNLFKYTYDVHGNLVRFQDGDAITETEYDGQKRATNITDPLGHVTYITYNERQLNNLGQYVLEKTETDPLGNQTVITYDAQERPASIVKKDSFGATVFHQEIFYDLGGNESLIIDRVNGQDRITKKEYNSHHQLMAQTEAADSPEQKITRYSYNKASQLECITKPDGTQLFHTYDLLNRLETLKSSDGTIDFVYTYDRLDNILTAEDKVNQTMTVRSYDAQGRMEKETLGNDLALTYTYDPLNRITSVSIPGRQIEYVYNSVALQSVNGSYEVLSRNLAGQPTKVRYHNQAEVLYTYDKAGQCLSVDHPAFQQTAQYDPIGNIISLNNKQFSYDALSQLIEEKDHLYDYDSVGNRLRHNDETYAYNRLNQISSKSFSYDNNGNMIGDEKNTYTYDALDRLTAVMTPTQKIVYIYDPFGRRLEKQDDRQRTLYIYLGEEEIGAYHDDKLFQLKILDDTNKTIAILLDDKEYTPLYDLTGNMTCLLDADENLVEEYTYNAFGEESFISTDNPWRYAGKRTDEETGLIYFGKRYYSPILGRWISPDPIGFADGPNLYAYVHNNPLRYFDRQGLFTEHLSSCPDIDMEFPFHTDPSIGRAMNGCCLGMAKSVNAFLFTPFSMALGQGIDHEMYKNSGWDMMMDPGFDRNYSFNDQMGTLGDFSLSTASLLPMFGVVGKAAKPGMALTNRTLNVGISGTGIAEISGKTGSFVKNIFQKTPSLGAVESYFGSKTFTEMELILTKKFGAPKGVGNYNKSFFNSRTRRTFNLHHDPTHRGGRPHIDIRKRGLDNDYYKNKPYFLKD